ncbi:hypothetical protein ARAM_005302 [Aspergillus rambellii]|uniref:DUF7907 domain-containing protein n=1 Tax=Aspergillus rambellii TaxID=308745 RepID=A0A0F8UMT6_9EURO|nr:hypothetical protein ARAM_005302 [Aspergillus rambellii]
MSSSTGFFLSFLTLSATSAIASHPYRYYLKSNNGYYLSSSMTYNGHINYVLLAGESLAQPLNLYTGDGSITVETSNVIGASSQAPLLLSDNAGISETYKQVILGEQKSGTYTKDFSFADDGGLGLKKDGFHGFVACTASKDVKQLYWATADGDVPVCCEKVSFTRQWYLNKTA